MVHVASKKSNKTKPAASDQLHARVIMPATLPAAIAKICGREIRPYVEYEKMSEPTNEKPTWEALGGVRDAIGGAMASIAEEINATVEMVKNVGCDHMAEFSAAVTKTNEDFNMFIGKFDAVRNRHEYKRGVIATPDDLALSLTIFEDYQSLRAHFDGVMHHTAITFTEFALEAKDRLLKQQQTLSVTAPEVPVLPVADTSDVSVVEQSAHE